jgi:hypothetical protein
VVRRSVNKMTDTTKQELVVRAETLDRRVVLNYC